MKRLQESRIDLINKYLQSSKLDPELLPEILDHLACEAEERLWDGKPFEQIYHNMMETADRQSLLNLSVDHQNLLAMKKSLNDIVFEGRNKLYGAYDLRKSYGQTIQRSVLMGVTLFLLLVMFPNLYARLVPESKPDDIAYIVEANPIDITPEILVKPPVKEEEAPAPKTVRSLPPVVLPDELVTIEKQDQLWFIYLMNDEKLADLYSKKQKKSFLPSRRPFLKASLKEETTFMMSLYKLIELGDINQDLIQTTTKFITHE